MSIQNEYMRWRQARSFTNKSCHMFCNKLRGRIKQILQQFDDYLDEHIDLALSVTTALKNLLSSPMADILTAIIPGDLDNVIRQHLLAALEKATETLLIADKCRQHQTLADKLLCLAEELQQRSPELRDALLHKLASLVAGEMDGQRLKQNLYDLYTQAKYAALK